LCRRPRPLGDLNPDNFAAAPVVELIRRGWGPSAFIRETRVL
jgi:hypothetical protein